MCALVAACIVAGVAAIYAPTLDFGFLQLDDDRYVTENSWVKRGLSAESLAWAGTALEPSNWHPLTLVSYMLDVELFGLDATGYHAENVVWHALNAVLLLWGLYGLTGRFWPSALAAAFFAWHPLRVESVAWISERKDVLSTALGLLCIGAYAAWTRRGGVARYLLAAALLALGLMAKPMLVTWPFLLLLVDVWPLGRAGRGPARLVAEKLPLLALAGISAVLTLHAQGEAASVAAGVALPDRLATALVSVPAYLAKTFWPVGLSALYPHPYMPGGVPRSLLEIAASGALLAGITTVLLLLRRPALTVGWLWFLAALAPVSGVVQVGFQGMADRYTYVPQIGLCIALSWGLCDGFAALGRRSRAALPVGVILAVLGLLACAARAADQVGAWRDDLTLVQRSLKGTPDSVRLRYKLGALLLAEGRMPEARVELEAALRLWPGWDKPSQDLAWVLATAPQAEVRDAARARELAEELAERTAYAHANTLDTLAAAYAAAGDFERAEATAQRAVALARRAGRHRQAEQFAARLRGYRNGRAVFELQDE